MEVFTVVGPVDVRPVRKGHILLRELDLAQIVLLVNISHRLANLAARLVPSESTRLHRVILVARAVLLVSIKPRWVVLAALRVPLVSTRLRQARSVAQLVLRVKHHQ